MIPKFRAWDMKHNEMFKDTFAITESGQVIVVEQDSVFNSPDYIFTDDLILMQSTGFLDKNGKEIFEGDVVKLKYTALSDYEFFKVTRFQGGSWGIDNRQRGSELWLRNEDCEIIGNIYENPELVEAENE